MAVSLGKQRMDVYLFPETIEKIKELYGQNDCRNRSEFIEKAIRFYVGYLTAEDKSNFLPNMFLSNMRSIVYESDSRQNKLLFKLAVEMALMMNLLAYQFEIDDVSLSRLRGECVKEVKRLQGSFSMEDALEWQRGARTDSE